MSGRKYFCLCEANCKWETMNKEQILAAIAQAAEKGLVFDLDAAFITKVKETNNGGYVTFWVGTRAQYNALETHESNCIYIFTDDTTDKDIAAALAQAIETANAANDVAAQALMLAKGAAPASLVAQTAILLTDSEVDAFLYAELAAMPAKSVRNVCIHVNQAENSVIFGGGVTHLTLRKAIEEHATIEAIRHGTAPATVRRWVRNLSNGVLMDWEWEYPPMEVGVEYCTTERYDGKPVYVKRIALNREVSNESNENVAMSITDTGIPSASTEIISMTGFALHPTYGAMPMPWTMQGTGEVLLYLFDVTFGDATRKIELCYRNTKLPALSVSDLQKLECTLKYVKV